MGQYFKFRRREGGLVDTGENGYFTEQPPEEDNLVWLPSVELPPPEGHNAEVSTLLKASRLSADQTQVELYYVEKPLPITSVKRNHLRRLQRQYDQLLLAGYQVPGRDYKLALGKGDRDAFGQFFTMLQQLVAIGAKTTEDIVVISDNRRLAREETVGVVFNVLTNYGIYYQQLWEQIARANTAIDAAQTPEAVLAVELTPAP